MSRLSLPLSRRQVLRLAAAAGALVAWPAGRGSARASAGGASTATGDFLTSDELAILEELCARIVPSDALPGAREAGAAHYIQGLLSALPAADANCDRRGSAADATAILLQLGAPADPGCDGADIDADGEITGADVIAAPRSLFHARPIFAGGPYSGRQPYGDFASGRATDRFPGNSFQSLIPLNRLQRIAWTARLAGAETLPELADNPLARSLAEVDLRRKYRDGLAAIDADSRTRFGAGFAAISDAQRDMVVAAADAVFADLVTVQTIEGMFCAPEYGGNRNLVGWQLIGFDGDSQPLGYTLGFDEERQEYIERADKPNSRPDPDESCAGFSAGVVRFLSLIAGAPPTQPGKRFLSPFCFGVGA